MTIISRFRLAALAAIGVGMFMVAMPSQIASAQENVFNYTEVPVDQQVPLTSATFDQGGYQLYDTQGETVIVPFEGHNLYTMKFARTFTDQMYFVNEDGVPVLYVPRHAYLVNAAVPGSRWYPFSRGYAPTTAVYLGIAPSWHDFVGMGWYPNMYCYGGYYSEYPHSRGAVVVAEPNFRIAIGSSVYVGWGPFSLYFGSHPAPYRPIIVHPDFYRWAAAPHHGGGPDSRGFHGVPDVHGGVHPVPIFGGDTHGAPGGSHGQTTPVFGGGNHGAPGGSHSQPAPVFGGGNHGAPGGSHSQPAPVFGGGNHGAPGGGGQPAPVFGGGNHGAPSAPSTPSTGGQRVPIFGGGTHSAPTGGTTKRPPLFGGASQTAPSGGGSAPGGSHDQPIQGQGGGDHNH